MEDMAASSGDVADGEVMSPIGRGDGGKAAVTSRSDTPSRSDTTRRRRTTACNASQYRHYG